jgi:hypothetical protein
MHSQELKEKIDDIIRPQIKLAQRVLARVIDVPDFAKEVGSEETIRIGVDSYADWITERAIARSLIRGHGVSHKP